MELLYFRPYYVFDVYPSSGPVQFFKVGTTPRKDSVKGWIPVSAAAIWDHRVAARYRRSSGRRMPPLTFYSDKQAVVELAKTGRTSASPLARVAYDSGADRTFMAWPIMESDRVEVDGTAGVIRLLS